MTTTVQLPSPAAISNTLFCITKASDRSYLAQTVHTSICAHVPNPPLIGSKTADTVSVRRRQRDLERLMFVYTRVRVNGRPTYIVEWSLSARHIDKKKKSKKPHLVFFVWEQLSCDRKVSITVPVCVCATVCARRLRESLACASRSRAWWTTSGK